MIDFEEDHDNDEGAPAWMATFADLMSLLVCFFVLLLSFSEMDVIKYKQIAGSLKAAFGVQTKIEAQSIPKGTSVIAREFSPGTPQPIPVEQISQRTTELPAPSLKVGDSAQNGDRSRQNETTPTELSNEQLRELLSHEEGVSKLQQVLRQGVVDGKIDVESRRNEITIRIRENGSFPSASATLSPQFIPVIQQLRTALTQIEGVISVEGHTDNVPISMSAFKSNWELSAARALSVANALMADGELDESRFMVVGHADTRPYRPNDSAENRAHNRRVEVVIRQGEEQASDTDLQHLGEQVPDIQPVGGKHKLGQG